MDQWFNQLFEIIGRQIESKKVNMLLPEILSELDIVARKQNIVELHEIYEFVLAKNPINTNDDDYNKEALERLKKEILKRHVMLRDFGVLSSDLNELMLAKNQKGINKLLSTWKDSKYVYNYLQEIIYNAKQKKKSYSPERAERTVKLKPTVKAPEKKPAPAPKPKAEKVLKPTIEKQVEIPTKPVLEIKPITKPEPVIEEIEQVTKEAKKGLNLTTPRKTKIENEVPYSEKSFSTKEIREESFTEPELFVKPEVLIKPKIDRDVPKPKVKSANTKKEVILEEKPVEIVTPKDPYQLFFDCVDILSKKYNMIVNLEVLKNLSNPKPNFSRFLVQYIDEQDRNARFFIELFKVLTEYSLEDLITYILDKSFKIKKLCTFNIGLFNVEDFKTKSELLDIIVKQDFDFIKMSSYERKLRLYIDDLNAKDETTLAIKKRVLEISRFAPLMLETFYAADALGFFKINLLTRNDRIIELDNLSHLYWALMYSVTLSVYVVRTKYTDFIESMNTTAEFSNALIKASNDFNIRLTTKTLASSYIRTIYKKALALPDYADWWDRQKDDLLESKHKALALLNPID